MRLAVWPSGFRVQRRDRGNPSGTCCSLDRVFLDINQRAIDVERHSGENMKNFNWLAASGLATGCFAIALGIFALKKSLDTKRAMDTFDQKISNHRSTDLTAFDDLKQRLDEGIANLDPHLERLDTEIANVLETCQREIRDAEKQSMDSDSALQSRIRSLQDQLAGAEATNTDFHRQLRNLNQQVTQLLQRPVPANSGSTGETGTDSPAPSIAGGVTEFNAVESLVVGYQKGKKDEATTLCQELGLEIIETDELVRFFVCRSDRPLTEDDLSRLKEASDLIKFAQPNDSVPIRPRSVPGTPVSYDRASPLSSATTPDDADFGRQWALRKINAPVAWQTIQSSDIRIAVIDSGVLHGHPDLTDNMLRVDGDLIGHDFASEGETIDDSSVRFTSGTPGDSDPNDFMGHGTHVAGIIAARGNNGTGVTGIVWNAKLLPIKIYLRQRTGDDSSFHAPVTVIAKAISYAIGNGAKVINCSWEMPFGNRPLLREVLAVAKERDVLVVCAAGNESIDLDNANEFARLARRSRRDDDFEFFGPIPLMIGEPASADDYSNIITVAASDSMDFLAPYSNFGETSVDITAPGGTTSVPVLSTWNNVDDNNNWSDPLYGRSFGTSIAAPHVAGAAALAWSHPDHRSKTAAEIKSLLIDNARKVESLKDRCRADGVLDISFLSTPAEPANPSTSPSDNRPPPQPVVRETPEATETPDVAQPAIARKQFGAGLTRYWNSNYEEALVYFEAAVELDPSMVEARYFRAFAMAQLGLHDQATNALNESLNAEKDQPLATWGRLLERIQGVTRIELERVRRRWQLGISTVLSPDMWREWSKRAAHSASPVVPGQPNN